MRSFRRHIFPGLLVISLLFAGIIFFLYNTPLALPDVTDLTTDLLVSLVLLCLVGWGMLLVIRAYPTRVGIELYALLLATLFSALYTAADVYLLKWTGPSQGFYPAWMASSIWLRFLLCVLALGWIATVYALRQKTDRLESDFQMQADAASLLREAELFKLRQQLQPHFLYNSLNSVNALILTQPEQAMEMTGKLSELLRSSVRREVKDLIPLEEELSYIETYLSIEAIRFGDRLQLQYDKTGAEDARIPPFLLQPLLENAIRFGLYGRTGAVTISLQITREPGMLLIRISNPFDPSLRPPSGTGFGLEGIRRRLYLLFARTDLLEIHQENSRTFTIFLKIPQEHV